MTREEAKAVICAAFGVTEAEVDAIDRAMGGPQARAERAQLERALLAQVHP